MEKKIKERRYSGRIVETNSGMGKTKTGERKVNGKTIVYLDDGTKILCNSNTIKTIGYFR
jgi:hypothetical protein